MATLVAVSVSLPPFPDNAARGNGQPIIVVSGFCSPSASTARLRVSRQGFAPKTWMYEINQGPAPTVLGRLERQIVNTAERSGRRVSLIGINLGGTPALEAAKRCPDRLAHVVTICSRVRLPVMTPLAPLAYLAELRFDDEARRTLQRVSEPPPVPLTAIVNPRDAHSIGAAVIRRALRSWRSSPSKVRI